MNPQARVHLTPSQQSMVDTFERHMQAEFEKLSVDETLATMVEEPYIINVPTLTGGDDLEGVRDFYAAQFIGHFPPDTEIIPVSRTVGDDQLVEELVLKFTHTVKMDWILPGVAPTGKKVEVPVVVVVGFKDTKMASERIYWDQASVLLQLGLIDGKDLPVGSADNARKLLQLATEGAE